MNTNTENHENVTQQPTDTVTTQIMSLAREYRNTRVTTYEILSKCLKLVLEIKDDDPALRDLEDYLNAKDIKVIGKYKIYRQVVKAVFDATPKTASNYGKVLIGAAKESIAPHMFVKWIKDKGGIENYLDSLKEDPPDRTQKIESGKQKLCEQSPACKVNGGDFKNIETSEDLVVLVGRITSSQDIEILDFQPPKRFLDLICFGAEKSLNKSKEDE